MGSDYCVLSLGRMHALDVPCSALLIVSTVSPLLIFIAILLLLETVPIGLKMVSFVGGPLDAFR